MILSILMLFSALTVLTAVLGWLPSDDTLQDLGLVQGGHISQNSSQDQVVLEPDATKQEVSGPDGLSDQTDLLEFPISDMASQGNSNGQLDIWPAESTIERIHQVDRTTWLNRSSDQQPLTGALIFLDPGHGGTDTGAIYPAHSSDPTVIEAEINLDVAQKTRKELEAMGASVLMIREDDTWQSIFYRIAWTGRYLTEQFQLDLNEEGYQSERISQLLPLLDQVMTINSDSDDSGGRGLMSGEGAREDLRLLLDVEAQFEEAIFLSIHCNSLEDDSSVSGLQVFYLTANTAYTKENELAVARDLANASPVYTMYQDESRRRLASLVQESILDRRPDMTYEGLKSLIDENYAVLREQNLTSVLIELGFLSNSHDRTLLLSAEGQQQMAEGIAEAVYHYYCLP